MKENICMKCGRRSCTFRSYDREDCPYEIKPPHLYERNREDDEQQEPANGWQKFNPLLKHFQIKEPALDFDVSQITRRLLAEVTDTTDAVIVEAIRKEAERQGFTDLYLIDRELVKKVIEGATPKRGQWLHDEYDCRCSSCSQYCEINDAGDYIKSKYCPNCGAKMDGEEELKK